MGKADDQLLESVGGMGPWQVWVIFLIWLSQYFQSMTNVAIVFMQYQPSFHCANNNNSVCQNSLGPTSVANISETDLCEQYVYDRSVMTETIVTQWNLVCDRAFRAADAQMVYMIGFFFGALLSGIFSDRFGRKKVVAISGALTAVAGLLQTYAPSFTAFLAWRFFVSISNVACYSTGFVLCMEVTTSKYRDRVGGLFFIPYAIGYMSLSLVAYMFRDWRVMHTVISIPVFFNIFYIWLLPESPRWLLSNGRLDDLNNLLNSAAKVNRRSSQQIHTAVPQPVESIKQPGSSERLLSFVYLLKYKKFTIRVVLMCFVWCVTSMVYYGVSLNIASFSGDLFANNAICGAVELPAYLLCVPLLAWGRKKSLCLTLLILSVALLLVPFLPQDLDWMRFPMAMLGKVAVTAAFAILFVQTAELYPTVVRDTGMGVCNSAARIGSVAAPYISLISQLNGGQLRYVPMIVYGSCAFAAAVAGLFLPETNKKAMPNDIQDIIGDEPPLCEKPYETTDYLASEEKDPLSLDVLA